MIISLIGFAIVLLITYWWSNSGAFSALIHFACVVTAGALAFAAWEPLAYRLLGGGASGYAKGLVLLGVFIAALAILRLLTDKLIPMNLTLPRAADTVIGGAFGLGSGLLSVGLLTIGIGHLQSTVTIGDYTGWSRRSDVPNAPAIGSDNAPILHVIDFTSGFFGYLSWGSYTPWLGGGTLDTHLPQLARTSGSLYRDSYSEGMGRVSIQPDAVSNLKLLEVAPMALSSGIGAKAVPAYAVQFTVSQDGYEGSGQQFVVGASQLRLIGDAKSGRGVGAFPLSWIQPARSGEPLQYFFNSPTSYVTSIEAQGDGTFTVLFGKDDLKGQYPKYFEMKGVRFALPRAAMSADLLGSAAAADSKPVEDPDATDIGSRAEFPDIKYSIGSTVINSNDSGNLTLDGSNYIIGGEQKFPRATTATVSSDLRVRGFQVSEKQKILRLDATADRNGVRIFPDVNEWVREQGPSAQSARVAVIDDRGAKYYAVGYVEDDGEWVLVKSLGGRPLTLRDIPIQAIGGGKKLTLHFRVPSDTKFVGVALVTPKETRIVNTLDVTSPKDI